MKSIFTKAIPAAALSLALAVCGAADARNCTKDERDDADRWLWLNERDKRLATEKHVPWGPPRAKAISYATNVLVHRDFLIGYHEELRVPLWVAYRLDGRGLNRVDGRINCFREDARLPIDARSKPEDYEEPVYDLGHLAPSEDMSATTRQNVNSFVMTNIVPQHGPFNRVIWRRLEGMGQKWAKSFGTVYVITGSIFDHDEDRALDDPLVVNRINGRVGIPSHFYKIFARECTDGRIEALTIILKHEKKSPTGKAAQKLLEDRISSISELEAITETSFFPDGTEKLLERRTSWPVPSAKQKKLPASCER